MNKKEKYKLSVSLLSEAPTVARTEERADECKHLGLFLSLSIRVSMETRREGGTGGGVAMGTDRVCMHAFCMHVNEC